LVRQTAFAGIATRRSSLVLTLKSASDIRSPRVEKREQTVRESLARGSPAHRSSTSRPAAHRVAPRCVRTRRTVIDALKRKALEGRSWGV
jgi:hypothetical protein